MIHIEKVIFLDIDGVLNSEEFFIKRDKKHIKALEEENKDYLVYDLDKKAVKILNETLNLTNCEIVLSSSWRIFGLERVNNALKEVGFKYEINYKTTMDDMDRGLQIKKFAEENNVENYIVLDDESFDIDKHITLERFIKTNWRTGMLECHKNRIVSYFKN